MAANSNERRTGMHDLSKNIGYLIGSVEGLHKKVDEIKDDVEINSGRITTVENRQDKVRNIAIGVTAPVFGAWTWVVVKWNSVQTFFQDVFGGTHG